MSGHYRKFPRIPRRTARKRQ